VTISGMSACHTGNVSSDMSRVAGEAPSASGEKMERTGHTRGDAPSRKEN
jgi:hypothetical protein